MKVENMKKICIIDGQGGGIGSAIIKRIKERFGETIEVIALGTNAIATAQMLKARANKGALAAMPLCRRLKRPMLLSALWVFSCPTP